MIGEKDQPSLRLNCGNSGRVDMFISHSIPPQDSDALHKALDGVLDFYAVKVNGEQTSELKHRVPRGTLTP